MTRHAQLGAVERQRSRQGSEAYIHAMWALFLLQSSKPESDLDGMYDLGTIESPRIEHQHLQRETPYSVCKGLR
jgi:hypothetical protein